MTPDAYLNALMAAAANGDAKARWMLRILASAAWSRPSRDNTFA